MLTSIKLPEKNRQEHNPDWPYKDEFINKIFLYVKDSFGPKYEYLIKKLQEVGQKHFKDPTVFTEYSDDIKNVFKSIGEQNLRRKRKILIVFDHMIVDVTSNKKPSLGSQIYLLGVGN